MAGISEAEATIFTTITPIFRTVLEDDSLELTRSLDAHQVEAWDSLNHITLVVELEGAFGVQFTTDELAAMANIGDLVDCLLAKGVA
ncbi:MAG TPA: acyl carrier protein [Rhodospirillaceae bacterium]|nr:acyl carrier protein [Rhodospirillaceae bacterium]|tara:strand:+ start:2970 stop:3230 length:261 start_codon:yes stop_codon:yes gene_type:complete